MRRARDDAFREFASTRTAPLYRAACLLTSGDTHFAEDLVQETLSRMYAQWGKIAKIDNPAGYAQTVLVRAFLATRRRKSSGERPYGDLPESTFGTSANGGGPGPGGGDPDLRISLLHALSQLPPKDRAVVVLRFWEDRSIEETANALDVTASAVRTRSSRALAKLRDQLGGSLVTYASG